MPQVHHHSRPGAAPLVVPSSLPLLPLKVHSQRTARRTPTTLVVVGQLRLGSYVDTRDQRHNTQLIYSSATYRSCWSPEEQKYNQARGQPHDPHSAPRVSRLTHPGLWSRSSAPRAYPVPDRHRSLAIGNDPPMYAYAPARSSKPHPRAPPPDPRSKPGPVFVASGGVISSGV